MAYVLPLMSTMATPSVTRWTLSSANADSRLGRCRGANIVAVDAWSNLYRVLMCKDRSPYRQVQRPALWFFPVPRYCMELSMQ